MTLYVVARKNRVISVHKTLTLAKRKLKILSGKRGYGGSVLKLVYTIPHR